MKQTALSLILCSCLIAPMGHAAEDRKTVTEPATATSAAQTNSPQKLSDQERAELSKRAEEPGSEVVGGALSNLHLTYIVIALAAAVLVLVLK